MVCDVGEATGWETRSPTLKLGSKARPKKRVTCREKSLTLHAPPGQLFSVIPNIISNKQEIRKPNPLSSLTQLIVITAGVFPFPSFCSLLQSLFCLLHHYPQYALVFLFFRNHTNSKCPFLCEQSVNQLSLLSLYLLPYSYSHVNPHRHHRSKHRDVEDQEAYQGLAGRSRVRCSLSLAFMRFSILVYVCACRPQTHSTKIVFFLSLTRIDKM